MPPSPPEPPPPPPEPPPPPPEPPPPPPEPVEGRDDHQHPRPEPPPPPPEPVEGRDDRQHPRPEPVEGPEGVALAVGKGNRNFSEALDKLGARSDPPGPRLEPVDEWRREGERIFTAAVGRLTDAELADPSRLPDWSRAMVIAHVARNADALVNLLTWARTGVETPMYASADTRNADITRTAAQPPADLRIDAAEAAGRLTDAVGTMTPRAWAAEVRTAQGRAVPASEVVWMRVREGWLHAVDLDAGVEFGDLPPDCCGALIDDALALFARRDQAPSVTLVATDTGQRWGSDPTLVRGPGSALAAWLTRGDASGLTGDPPPSIPRWL